MTTDYLLIIGLLLLLVFATAVFLLCSAFYKSKNTVDAIGLGIFNMRDGYYDYIIPSLQKGYNNKAIDVFNDMSSNLSLIIANLSLEKETLLSVVDTMADAVIMVNANLEVNLVNKAAREFFDIDEYETKRLSEIIRDYEIIQLCNQCILNNISIQQKIELHDKRKTIKVTVTPIVFNADQRVLLTITDISFLVDLDLSQKEFVSNVSHELKNPITSIGLLVENLQSELINSNEVERNFLFRINQEVSRMATLVDDLLELSRIEAQGLTFTTAPHQLNMIVGEAINLLNNRNNIAASAILSFVSPDIFVLVNPDKIIQVLVNLLENAISFTDENRLITLSTKLSRINSFVEVTVTDNGIGISTEHITHIFDRFYKVDSSRSSKGTGLGLSIVKHLIESHGGTIYADSKIGQGSSFTATLPTVAHR
jgi:two-component system phosphate regulon sensor histidine kinase PhoR